MFNPIASVRDGRVRILWPENRLLSVEKVIMMAKDEVANSSNFTETFQGGIEEAIELLDDSGKLTFGKF